MSLHCSNLSLSQGPHSSFPISPCVPSHSFSSSTWTGGAILFVAATVTFLLTDGLPSTLLTSLRLVRSEELHSCAKPCWETKKVTEALTSYQIKVKQKGAILFCLFWENRGSSQTRSSLSKRSTNTGLGQMMYLSLWLYTRRVPIPPPSFLSFCELSDETLLSCTCYWEWGLGWVIWPTSSWTQLFASPHVGAQHFNVNVSVTSCLDHRSLQGCQGSQLDS